jgi:hypothetical protein
MLLCALVARAVTVVWLWWRGTPARTLNGPGEALTAAGRVSGLLGGYLLLVEVMLMSRIPWLERRIGNDWVAAAHRALGGYLVSVLVAHTVLIVAGYAVTAHVGMASETARVVLDEPDVLMATVALALLVGVGWLGARRAAPAGVRDLVLPASVRLPGGAARLRPSARGRRPVHRRPDRARGLERRAPGGRGVPAHVPRRWATAAGAAAPHAGRRRQARGPGRRLGVRHGPGPGVAARGGRPVLPLAVPHGRPLVADPPVLAVGRAERALPAADRQGVR